MMTKPPSVLTSTRATPPALIFATWSGGTSLTRSAWPESSAATRVVSSGTGRKTSRSIAGALRRVQHPLDAELDRSGVERLAVVELDPAAQLELPGRVGEQAPRLGEVALELERLEVAPQQRVEDLPVGLVGVLVAVHVPVERRRLARLDDHHRLRLCRGAGHEQAEKNQDGNGCPRTALCEWHCVSP